MYEILFVSGTALIILTKSGESNSASDSNNAFCIDRWTESASISARATATTLSASIDGPRARATSSESDSNSAYRSKRAISIA
jgi:hypothetical protein